MGKDSSLREEKVGGKLFRFKVKSGNMQCIVSELDEGATSDSYSHKGEEVHIVLQGKIEYTVGKGKHILEEGDILWHKSELHHKATNIGKGKARYATVGTPSTFKV